MSNGNEGAQNQHDECEEEEEEHQDGGEDDDDDDDMMPAEGDGDEPWGAVDDDDPMQDTYVDTVQDGAPPAKRRKA